MLRPFPIVQFDVLHYQASDQHTQIPINTPAWYAWLTEASSFTFVNEYGMFFAYKEHTGNQRGGWYWRASCRREGKLRRAYLGKAENLSLQRLEEAARVLTLAPAQGEDPLQDLAQLIPQAMHDSLLATKLHAPGLRPRLVPRPRLTQRLQSNWEKPLLLLSAPAGFGKSTLLAEWLAESPIPIAWLSLEAQENRPERFLTYLIAALQTLFPRCGKNALALLSSLNTPITTASSEEVLTLLLNEVISSKFPPFILILHDYHVITAKQVHEAVTFLLHHLPAQMHLLLATREDPPLPLARLRSENALYELRVTDLRFTPEETRTFLLDMMALPLAPEQCLLLHTRTEGWITGLQLVVLAMQGRDDLSAFVQDFTGNHSYIMDYILQEVLERQTEGMRVFLVHTSLLERLNASLCNAVCKREDSQYLLEQLEHTNLFITPLDDQHQWFRYHQLFAEVLRHCLQRTFPTLILELHQRAHDWYMRAALFAQAKYHAKAIQELEGVPVYPDAIHIEPLTERESDVLRLLVEGADNRAIARELVLSVNTVKKHIVHLYAKLHVQNRGQAIARAMMLRR